MGVQTDEHAVSTDLTIKKNLPVSRKLAGIWKSQNDQSPTTNLVSKLFVACEADLQFLFGFLGLNIPSKKTTIKVAPNHCIQADEAAKVSHLYLTLTKVGIKLLLSFVKNYIWLDLCNIVSHALDFMSS